MYHAWGKICRSLRQFRVCIEKMMPNGTLIFRFIPETLPWLYQHGKLDKLRAEVTRITHINGRKNVGKLNFTAQKNTVQCIEPKRTSFLQLFSSVRMAIKTITLAVIW